MIDLDQIFDEVRARLDEDLSGAESTRFRRALKRGVVTFRYTKKDGTSRPARGTLMKSELPSYRENRRPRYNPRGFVYWDMDKGGFRSFIRANFVEWDRPGRAAKGAAKDAEEDGEEDQKKVAESAAVR